MIIVRKNKKIFNITQIWFADKLISKSPFRLIMYKQSLFNEKIFGFIKEQYCTAEINLYATEEEIFSNFTPTVKNEIRRCEKESGLQVRSNNDLDKFMIFYNEFALFKGLPKLTLSRLNGYQDYYISDILFNETIISKHMYVVDKNSLRVRLLHSPSIRFDRKIDKSLIGRANKYLHLKDMLYFKKLGFSIYDFGGIAIAKNSKKKLEGINKFKFAFGSNASYYSDYYSLPYYLFLSLSRIVHF